MNRIILIAIVSLAMAAGRAALAQETNAAPALEWSSFQSIAQKNIFDPTRSGTARPNRIKSAPRIVRTFTFHGTIDDTALFTGDGVPASGYVNVGDMLNGFKVRKIPMEYLELPTVVLTDPGGAIIVLKQDESMRREEDGPWTNSFQPPPLVIAGPEIRTDDSAASASPAPADESDILKKLRLKREQENK